MKKICMIIPSFDAKGGIASVVSGYRGSELERCYQIRYVETYCDGTKVAKFWKAIMGYFCFLNEIFLNRPDLVHIHSAFGASFYRKMPFILLASALRIPVINHIHGSELEQFYWKTPPYIRKIKCYSLRKCTKIIVLSDEWRRQFERIVPSDRITVIENYTTIQEEVHGNRQRRNYVLFMGFLTEKKGCLDIPKVVSLVKANINDVEFVLAGTGTAESTEKIHYLAKQYTVEDKIKFPGWVHGKDKNDLLQDASLFFLPSYSEGMPMSILEAMGCGLPIVSTDVGGIPQLVKNGVNGYLCKPGDVKGFADCLVKILNDPSLMKKMGEESQRMVQERYSLQRHIIKLSELYENVCH